MVQNNRLLMEIRKNNKLGLQVRIQMDSSYVGMKERDSFTLQRPIGFSCITGFTNIFREVTQYVKMSYLLNHAD